MIPSFKAMDKKSLNIFPVTSITWRNDGSILQVEIQKGNKKEYIRLEDWILECNGCELG